MSPEPKPLRTLVVLGTTGIGGAERQAQQRRRCPPVDMSDVVEDDHRALVVKLPRSRARVHRESARERREQVDN